MWLFMNPRFDPSTLYIILKQYKNVFSIVIIQQGIRKNKTMNCVASTYNASGKLVGCTEQELSAIVSVQLYTVFAMGAGLYVYKSLTAENWADIAIQIGWGCVSAFTHTKRFTTRYMIPPIFTAVSFVKNQVASVIQPDTESEVSVEDDHCYIRVVKDGTELHGYSSIFGLIQHLADEHTADDDVHDQEQAHDSDDVVDVQSEVCVQSEATVKSEATAKSEEVVQDEAVDQADEEELNESEADSSDNEEDIKEQIARIEKHTMQFDFVMCQVPTLQTVTSSTPQCMHVIKYDGFPRDADGSYFFDRKFVPVDHRMIEIVLQYAGSEYELDLASPDNFYVAGNRLLDPAFLKWFMRKNHGVNLVITANHIDSSGDYAIKCIDHDATLHTLLPCNYLRVTETGFEVQDSGLV